MKRIIIFSTLIFLLCMVCSAQEAAYSKASETQSQIPEPDYEPVGEQVLIDDFNTEGGGYSECFYYGDPSGMYLSEDWEKGKADLVDGSSMEGHFRYNLYKQKMEAIIEGDTFAFAKPCELEMLNIGENKYVYSSFVRGDQEVANTWFEVLCEGEYSLFIRRFIKYRVTDGDDDISNDQLYRQQEYYTRKGENKLERFYASKKILKETFTDHGEEVTAFLKKENIKLKEEGDLVKVFAYYNTLE